MIHPNRTLFPSKPFFQFVFRKQFPSFFFLRIILFGIRILFLCIHASSWGIQFNWENIFIDKILSFVPSNRSKIDWRGQGLHGLTRLGIQVHFSSKLLVLVSASIFESSFFANRISLRVFGVLFLPTRSLEADVASTFSYVSYFFLLEDLPWNYQLCSSSEFFNRHLLLAGFFKRDFWFDSLRWKPTRPKVSSRMCCQLFSRNTLNFQEKLFVFSFQQGVNQQNFSGNRLSVKQVIN